MRKSRRVKVLLSHASVAALRAYVARSTARQGSERTICSPARRVRKSSSTKLGANLVGGLLSSIQGTPRYPRSYPKRIVLNAGDDLKRIIPLPCGRTPTEIT
jgi:hypothetical protein